MRRAGAKRGLPLIVLLAICRPSLAVDPLAVPFFRQQKNGCGAASVAMVAHYWGSRGQEPLPTPGQVYEALYDASRKAIPLAGMRRYVEDLGFRAFTLRGTEADLDHQLRQGRPLVVALKPGRKKGIHFAVLTGIDSGSVWLNDPTRKKPLRIKLSEFNEQWKRAEQWMLLAAPANPE